mmetsp:Transcript_73540/g.142256  ORF Transcript_73540/g.142256 Transcript_73540/m.142256 type:complete len:205 (+) Transcript_73540:728-1342(+)
MAQHSLLHHARSCVHGVTKQPVARQFCANNPSKARSSVYTHLVIDLFLTLVKQDLPGSVEKPPKQRSMATTFVVLYIVGQHADGGHIFFTDGFNLCDLVFSANIIHQSKAVVEKIEQLTWRLVLREHIEIRNDHKEDGDLFEWLGYAFFPHELENHMLWHHIIEDFVDLEGRSTMLLYLQELQASALFQGKLLMRGKDQGQSKD